MINHLRTMLDDYSPNPDYPHDRYIKLTCMLALQAVEMGNFGIGCVLVDETGEVVVQGHNETFKPIFRSDRHAEMVVMNKFENTHPQKTRLEDYALYTSLEPCTMCFARLIISGVNTVYYAAHDANGGMVQRLQDMPPSFIQFAKGQTFAQANCSAELINTAHQIFQLNAEELDANMMKRNRST